MALSPLDTFDYEPIELDLGNVVGAGESIVSVTFVVPAMAAVAGILVDTVTNPPLVVTGYGSNKPLAGVKFWVLCDVTTQEDNVFNPKFEFKIGLRLVLNSGRKLERHLALTFMREVALVEA